MKSGKMIAVSAVGFGLLFWGLSSGRAQSAGHGQLQGPDTAGKTAAQAFKNIQILKDIPADQLIPSMQFISASLGVECEFCHVPHAFEKDDKKEKQTARQMMTMMFAINKDNFKGRREVTCYSCHHGMNDPASTPMIEEEVADVNHGRGAQGAESTANAAPKVTADQVIDKYLQALGGTAALEKIDSRVEHGHISVGSNQMPIDVYAKAPDKRLSAMHMQNGESITAFNGQTGWLQNGGNPPRPMNETEDMGAKIDAQLSFPQNLKQMFDDFRVARPEKIGEQEQTVLVGRKRGQPPVRLYFNPDSGLLTRVVRYSETPLGRLPVQIDFADYKEVGGVKVPEQWTLARVGGRFTIQIDQVDQQQPIPDSKFAQPAGVAGQKSQ